MVMKKKLTILLLIIVFLSISITIGVKSVRNKFDEPCKVAEQFVQDAKLNKVMSSYLIEEKSWDSIQDKSIFRLIRKKLDWNDFKNKIQGKDVSSITIGEKYSLFHKLRNLSINSMHMDVYIYDAMGVEKDFIPLLLERVDGNWVIVGIEK
jgi:hypothetical protein